MVESNGLGAWEITIDEAPAVKLGWFEIVIEEEPVNPPGWFEIVIEDEEVAGVVVEEEEEEAPEEEEKEWVLIGEYTWDSYDDTGPGAVDWTQIPGDYSGIGGSVQVGDYDTVLIRPISGWWSDGPGDYEGSLGFKTQEYYATLGYGGSLESNQKRYTSQGDALSAWLAAAPRELPLGDDKRVVWGFQEGGATWYLNNTGSLVFVIYAR